MLLGGTWRVRSISADRAEIELCTCAGEPVERLESSDPGFLRVHVCGAPRARRAATDARELTSAAPLPRRSSTRAPAVASIGAWKHRITHPPSVQRAARAHDVGRLARLRESHFTALALLLTAPFMVVLDFFIVNVAIPSLSLDLHAGPTVIEWVVAGYGLTTAVGLVAAGRLGDRVGRRKVFLAGMLVFTVASAICGLAPSGGALVAARLVQGVGAALVTPQVLSIMSVVYQGKERARAFGIYGMTLGLAAVLGQLIGGLLIQADVFGLGWRACFLINVPVGLVALALVPRLVPESRVEGAGRLDLVGMALITAGLTTIVLPLIEGRSQGWPRWTWISLAVSPVILGVFATHQGRLRRRGGEPLLDPALFRERAFTAGLLTTLAFFASMASFFLVLALYLQPGRGLDALQAGLVFTILAVAYLAASMRAAELAARFGRRLPALGGVVLAAGSRCARRDGRRDRHPPRRAGADAGPPARRRRHGPRAHAAHDDGARARCRPSGRVPHPGRCRPCRTSATRSESP